MGSFKGLDPQTLRSVDKECVLTTLSLELTIKNYIWLMFNCS